MTESNPWHYRRTLAVALYRAGDWKAAAEAFEAVGKLRSRYYGAILPTPDISPKRENDDDSIADEFFLAMTEWQRGNKGPARRHSNTAVGRMKEGHRPKDEELRRFREEATHLMGIEPDHD